MHDRQGRDGAAFNQVWKGRLLLLGSAAAFSTAGFFTRAAPVDPWAMTFWRGMFGCAVLFAVLARNGGLGPAARLGPRAWAVVAASAAGTLCYIAAFARTSVADVSIIYATAPLMTAGLAWLCLRERPARVTLAAAALALVGAAVTVSGAAAGGGALGDGLALAMTLSLSIMAVLARGGGFPVLLVSFVSALLSAGLALGFGCLAGSGFAIGWHDAAWLAAFGVVTLGLAMPGYLAGAAAVPAGEAMLISASEMPMAPFWVWIAFGEVPSAAALAGGALVAIAVLADLSRVARPAARSRPTA